MHIFIVEQVHENQANPEYIEIDFEKKNGQAIEWLTNVQCSCHDMFL